MKTSAPAIFCFAPSVNLRSVTRDTEPWFVAMDVASALDYSDTEAMTRRLDDDEKQNLQIVGFGPRGVTRSDNYSTKGNVNPYTGKAGTRY